MLNERRGRDVGFAESGFRPTVMGRSRLTDLVALLPRLLTLRRMGSRWTVAEECNRQAIEGVNGQVAFDRIPHSAFRNLQSAFPPSDRRSSIVGIRWEDQSPKLFAHYSSPK
jgi:hypothetical protein